MPPHWGSFPPRGRCTLRGLAREAGPDGRRVAGAGARVPKELNGGVATGLGGSRFWRFGQVGSGWGGVSSRRGWIGVGPFDETPRIPGEVFQSQRHTRTPSTLQFFAFFRPKAPKRCNPQLALCQVGGACAPFVVPVPFAVNLTWFWVCDSYSPPQTPLPHE